MLELLFLILNLIIFVSMILLYPKWKTFRKEIRNEHFGGYKSKHHSDGGWGGTRYLRLPYLNYKMEATTSDGYVEIGDFMMQWGRGHSENIAFKRKYDQCFGFFIIPLRGGGGEINAMVRWKENYGANVYAAGSESPFCWFSYGSRMQKE